MTTYRIPLPYWWDYNFNRSQDGGTRVLILRDHMEVSLTDTQLKTMLDDARQVANIEPTTDHENLLQKSAAETIEILERHNHG